MPLAVGNAWTYEEIYYGSDGSVHKRATVTIFVLSGTLLEGERWFCWGTKKTTMVLCTNRADGLWSRSSDQPTSGPWAMYPAEAGNLFTGADGDTIRVIATDHLVAVPGGTFSRLLYETPALPLQSHRLRYREFFYPNIGQVQVDYLLSSDTIPEYLIFSSELISYSVRE